MSLCRKIRYWIHDRWVLVFYMTGKNPDPVLAENLIKCYGLTGVYARDVKRICK